MEEELAFGQGGGDQGEDVAGGKSLEEGGEREAEGGERAWPGQTAGD